MGTLTTFEDIRDLYPSMLTTAQIDYYKIKVAAPLARRFVTDGVYLLSAYAGTPGGWRDLLDVDRLNMASSADCVLGQLFDDFDDDKAAALRQFAAFGGWADTNTVASPLTHAWRAYLVSQTTPRS